MYSECTEHCSGYRVDVQVFDDELLLLVRALQGYLMKFSPRTLFGRACWRASLHVNYEERADVANKLRACGCKLNPNIRR
jgi:hypothetical protein